ncbi:hypothetical protein ATJ93_4213 [Halopiger aswanensis]|uniref:Uncharacterized protein n=1 Tax=Halopiger aswanensis TaxID=148449 RepID=A0A3R7FT12_9EURY|nr:hypothetical protein ATJ93_4213 [Halopiger aswanensis]
MWSLNTPLLIADISEYTIISNYSKPLVLTMNIKQ